MLMKLKLIKSLIFIQNKTIISLFVENLVFIISNVGPTRFGSVVVKVTLETDLSKSMTVAITNKSLPYFIILLLELYL